MKLLSIGSDPELFLKDQFSNLITPAVGLIGGSKINPLPLEEKGFFIQEDNVLVEFNIPPSINEDEFVSNINKGLKYTKNFVGDMGFELVCAASHVFEPSDLNQEEACEFGCIPDFNAYTGDVNLTPNGRDTRLRTSSGHIHAAYKSPNEEITRKLVKAMDITLGVPSVLIDSDRDRRKLYGKAGSYRHKPKYGLEYRSLSSFWLDSEGKIRWAYKGVNRAFEELDHLIDIPEEDSMLIQEAINHYDEKKAKYIVEKYKVPLV